VFADLGAGTYNLDPADVQRRITPKTKAIIAVHLTGNPCDMNALKALAERHKLEMWSDAHWRMIRAYAKLMRRGRQTDFLLPMGLIDVKEEPKGTFSFSWGDVERLIRMFFDLGFTHINGGHIATRTEFNASNFVLSAQPKLDAVSRDGYNFLAQYLFNWEHFLRRNGWYHRTIQHVGDEPTEHSAKDYRVLAGIVRKF
jgi:hypothetical protein